uniref:CW-type domain-containing protein n=1 Tax=Salix viminalis TaxID=40686 RepID=A0A6N2KVJ8_SALVM
MIVLTARAVDFNPRVAARSIDTYTVQCDKCSKWRLISPEEEYEEIRSKMKESSYVCDRKLGISCDDPADIEYNVTRTWLIDRPDIPKTPQGFKRSLVLRRDFSRHHPHRICQMLNRTQQPLLKAEDLKASNDQTNVEPPVKSDIINLN